MHQVTLSDFDCLSLSPVEPLEPEQIRNIRQASHVSQAVFARILNTIVSTVQKWEIGKKKPARPRSSFYTLYRSGALIL